MLNGLCSYRIFLNASNCARKSETRPAVVHFEVYKGVGSLVRNETRPAKS